MSVAGIAQAMAAVKRDLDAAKEKVAGLQKQFDELRKKELPDAMDEAGIESVRVKGLGSVGLRTDAYVSIKPGKHVLAYEWLEENGLKDVIKDHVAPSTLKAVIKEQFKSGVAIPDDLFNCSPYTYAVITKGN